MNFALVRISAREKLVSYSNLRILKYSVDASASPQAAPYLAAQQRPPSKIDCVHKIMLQAIT